MKLWTVSKILENYRKEIVTQRINQHGNINGKLQHHQLKDQHQSQHGNGNIKHPNQHGKLNIQIIRNRGIVKLT